MKFQIFVDRLKTRLGRKLPGEDVQFLMAPIARQRIREIPPEDYHPRKSAVLILLFPAGESIRLVLIERPVYEGVHSGQVAFPGGKYEETDVDLQQTALRETFEEVGVPASNIVVIGKLSDLYINPSNFLVSPYIGYSTRIPDFVADLREVKSIITTDLFELSAESIKGIKTITHSSGFKIKTPYYEIGGLTVWGATAMMISELNAVVKEVLLIS
ncbi:MAG: hydrolase [Bacteroidetes bacterium]|nr:hydrolase [Bacteroidota bacterium]